MSTEADPTLQAECTLAVHDAVAALALAVLQFDAICEAAAALTLVALLLNDVGGAVDFVDRGPADPTCVSVH